MVILILLKCISSQPLLKAFNLERIPLMTLLERLVVMLDFLWDMLWFNFPRPLCHLFHLFERECQAKCCQNDDENKESLLINILTLIQHITINFGWTVTIIRIIKIGYAMLGIRMAKSKYILI